MENATKALLIAAGVLLGLMIISLSLIMRNNVSNYYENQKNENIRKEIATFNGQYLIYQKNDLRGNELISLINKILDFNEDKADEEPEMEISITINDTGDARAGFYYKYDKYNRSGATNTTWLKIGKTYVHKAISGKENIEEYLVEIKDLESRNNGKYKKVLETLSANLPTLIPELSGLSEEKRQEAVRKQTELLQRVGETNYRDALRNDALKYYQYQQFRRAHFECKVTNFTETGRVQRFEVTFTNRFE